MLSSEQVTDLILKTVSQNIHNFFERKEVKVTHMLDHIFPRERKIRSLIGGLETSMGTRVWEPLAKAFAASNGYDVLDEKAFNASVPLFLCSSVPVIPDNVTQFISLWEKRKLADKSLLLSDYWQELKQFVDDNVDVSTLSYQKMPKGQGVDIILSKNVKLYLSDIKTNQLNAGGGPKFMKNFLDWYAYLALMKSTDDAVCFLAFPFDPHAGRFWVKESGKVSPLIPSVEAYVADEFWDLLSGLTGTTEIIESTFKELGSDFGQQFEDHFK
ncbi:TdeIII family type II restriction endonuclease [Photobacterium kishitanii]|uniref:TdeIII family type II restriction endonuclease n=1 Tax=Photobacterium kishitanii TaxID=318456 RepID=UPI0015E7E1D3|nr:TdeIII family type II restriction endonuclease [Photobacterium kishitanii]